MGLQIKRIIIILLPIFFLILSFFLPSTLQNITAPTIPKINITLNGVDLSTIETGAKSTKYPGNSLTLTSDSATTFEGVELKGHGNSTWYEAKKPFQIKFSQKTSLLGLSESKKYLLLADAFDSTHLKNAIAFHLEEMLSQPFNLHGQHVNLYINDAYQGLYYLTEKIEIGPNRINLKNPLAIIVEHEGLHAHLESECYQTTTSTCLVVKDVGNNNLKSEAIAGFLRQYLELEIAAANHDYTTVQELIDVDSFAKYYLLSDFTMNLDAFMSSYFFYRDGPGDKIHVGPGWDFDLAFGTEAPPNLNYGIDLFSPYVADANQVENRTGIGSYGESESLIMYHLIHIPEFKSRVDELYRQYLYNRSTELLSFVNDLASSIQNSALIDNEKWSLGDFTATTESLKDWIRVRYNYLDEYYGNRPIIPQDQIIKL